MAGRVTTLIPLARLARFVRERTGLRFSNEAKKYFEEKLREYIEEVAVRAGEVAKHAKRKTITKEDIQIALKQ